MKGKANPELLTTAEAAEYLGMTPGSLANICSQKKGPRRMKRGNRVYFELKDLQAWDKARTEKIDAYQ